jgi:uncharacterized protein YecT (DUF1311 family)
MNNGAPRRPGPAWKLILVALTGVIALSLAIDFGQAGDASAEQLNCTDSLPQATALPCAQKELERLQARLNAFYQKLKDSL